MSNAFRGRELPSRKTVSVLVGVLGGDQEEWLRRWSRLRAAGLAPSAAATGRFRPENARKPGWRTVAVGAACLAVGFGGGVAVATLTPPDPSGVLAVATGADPWGEPKCLADGARKRFGTRADHYLIEVIWSDACQAAWGQVSRFDGERAGNRLTAKVFLPYEPGSEQTATGSDVQTVHTSMLAQPGGVQEICVTGVAQIGADEIDLGPAVCWTLKGTVER